VRRASPFVTAALAVLLTGAAPAGGLPLQELPPQKLAKGECALVVWTHAPQARRVAMILDGPPRARVRLDGRTRELARTSAEGAAVAGQTARQAYAGEGVTLSLDLDMAGQRPVPGGVAIPDGALDYRDPSGWSVVVPVGGLIACEPR